VSAQSNAVTRFATQAPGLPKTRSGKIMRRILRKLANKQDGDLGDTSTLADPTVVEQLITLRGL
jgi:acetyl-CoA synthetase